MIQLSGRALAYYAQGQFPALNKTKQINKGNYFFSPHPCQYLQYFIITILFGGRYHFIVILI